MVPPNVEKLDKIQTYLLRDYGQNADARIYFEGCGNLKEGRWR
jgi:hypothetical protein